MQMTSAWSFSVLSICIEKKASVAFVVCLCAARLIFVRLHSVGSSPAGSVNEWQTELGAGEVSTTNSLKHTTDIKDNEWRKNTEEKRSRGASRRESERSTGDRPN